MYEVSIDHKAFSNNMVRSLIYCIQFYSWKIHVDYYQSLITDFMYCKTKQKPTFSIYDC